MTKFIVTKGRYTENHLDGIPMYNRCECESEVLPENLGEPFGNKPPFEMGNLAIFVTFNVENLLALYCFLSFGS